MLASMGPQFFHCGNFLKLKNDSLKNKASMGPQFFHCGNTHSPHPHRHATNSFNGAAVLSLRKCSFRTSPQPAQPVLQWGRSSFTAEMTWSVLPTMVVESLQWGRSSFTAEMQSVQSTQRW